VKRGLGWIWIRPIEVPVIRLEGWGGGWLYEVDLGRRLMWRGGGGEKWKAREREKKEPIEQRK
jgi:hypothetical protein